VKTPATDAAPLGDHHPLGAAVRDDDLGRHSVRLVLDVHDRVLGQSAHAAEERLAVSLDEGRTAGELG
jgi:hypothetical protein